MKLLSLRSTGLNESRGQKVGGTARLSPTLPLTEKDRAQYPRSGI